jgi:4-amino-4-deoxy-L-arabinose transferase-like glycosyltransferase
MTVVHDLRNQPMSPGLPPPPIAIEVSRERVRGILAIALLSLLGLVILSLLLAAIADWLTTTEITDLLDPLITPLVALTGTALGFYFGRASD